MIIMFGRGDVDKMSISEKQWQELNEMLRRSMPSVIRDGVDYYRKMLMGEYYDNNNLKGKKCHSYLKQQ